MPSQFVSWYVCRDSTVRTTVCLMWAFRVGCLNQIFTCSGILGRESLLAYQRLCHLKEPACHVSGFPRCLCLFQHKCTIYCSPTPFSLRRVTWLAGARTTTPEAHTRTWQQVPAATTTTSLLQQWALLEPDRWCLGEWRRKGLKVGEKVNWDVRWDFLQKLRECEKMEDEGVAVATFVEL